MHEKKKNNKMIPKFFVDCFLFNTLSVFTQLGNDWLLFENW